MCWAELACVYMKRCVCVCVHKDCTEQTKLPDTDTHTKPTEIFKLSPQVVKLYCHIQLIILAISVYLRISQGPRSKQ